MYFAELNSAVVIWQGMLLTGSYSPRRLILSAACGPTLGGFGPSRTLRGPKQNGTAECYAAAACCGTVVVIL